MMPEYATVLLTWFIMFGPSQGKKEAAEATYKASGLEGTLVRYSETYPEGTRQLVGNSAIIITGVVNRYVTYTWRF